MKAYEEPLDSEEETRSEHFPYQISKHINKAIIIKEVRHKYKDSQKISRTA